jgi:hypothetical protein
MPKFTRAFAAPLVTAGLLIAVAGCTSATTTAAAASGTQHGSATSAAASNTAGVTSSPSTPSSPSAPGSPSTAASTSNSNTQPSPPPPATPSQSVGENRPFPGIWDITSWQQYTAAQQSVEQGHQPWLLDPASVVQAWASQWNPVPAVRQIATDTFQVTKPGTNTVYTIHGTRPVPRGAAAIWVITSITHS